MYTDIFEWHFTIRGPEETDFEGGLYHGRILLPNNYPFAPPSLMFLTPNGRFELHKKVCLSITGYHPEYWQPAWGIRTVLVAVMGFLPTQSKGAIGGLDTSVEARKALAIKSRTWACPTCRLENVAILPDVAPEDVVKASLKAGEMPPEFSFGYEADKKKQRQVEEEQRQSRAAGDNSSNDAGSRMEQEKRAEKDQASSSTSSSAASTPMPSITTTETRQGVHTTNGTGPASSNVESPATSQLHDPSSTPDPAAAVSTTPLDPPRTSGTASPTGLRARAAVHSPQSQPQAQTQMQAQMQTVIRRAQSGIPMWLDALILGFGGLLVFMVIRRFM
ncbi:hypothetical protein BGZ54_001445 [Gamsiella multidivaricata]|nr:hypothetical protein BGZ54_001445 [Gamsiella multidivaricata]